MKALGTVAATLLSLTAWPQAVVLINELQGANRKTIVAQDGSTPDWVELYNPTSSTIDLQACVSRWWAARMCSKAP